MKSELLRMEHISKSFPGLTALNNVNINVFEGEVLGLMGENGAGKTTLMRILSGSISKDSGIIYFKNKKVEIDSPNVAHKLGISSIYQNFSLVPHISIAQNLFLIKHRFFYNPNQIYKKSKDLLKLVGLEVDPKKLINEISLAQKQMVAVAKVLADNAKLIIMDDTTSMLSIKEVKIITQIIRKLKKLNVSVIFISHKINEVFDVADRITVLRDGCTVGNLYRGEWSEEKLIKLMIGSELSHYFTKSNKIIGDEILKVENLSNDGLLKNVSFTLRKGEVLSIAGLVGSGKSELLETLFGLRRKTSGTILLNNEKIEIKRPKDAMKNKIAFVPEDTRLKGLILNMTVKSNITLPILKKVSKNYFINKSTEEFLLNEYLKQLNIKNVISDKPVEYLSSGQQQKLVLAKCLALRPQILLLDEPTSDVDIPSRKHIYKLIDSLSKEGVSIILVSSELREVTANGDRIIIMKHGELVAEMDGRETTQSKLLIAINK